MANTIKHRHQTVIPDAGADVDANEWNDSLVVASATAADGDYMVRSSAAADGWTFVAPPAAPAATGLVLIETGTAASSSALTFTGISATYDDYLFEMVNVRSPAGSVSLLMQVSSDGGGTWLATNYKRVGTFVASSSTTVTGVADTSTSFAVGGTIEPAGAGVCGAIRMRAPAVALGHAFHFESSWLHTDTSFCHFTGHFWHTTAVAINAVRFTMSAGNIASGFIRLYGISK